MKIVIFWTLAIFVSLPVAPFVIRFLKKILPLDVYGIIFSVIAVLFTGLLLFFIVWSRKWVRLVLLPFIGIFILIANAPEEKVHILEYVTLGILTRKTMGNKGIVYVGVVGILDEIIQYFLPMRYFDLRDILLNLGPAILGFFIPLPRHKTAGG